MDVDEELLKLREEEEEDDDDVRQIYASHYYSDEEIKKYEKLGISGVDLVELYNS